MQTSDQLLAELRTLHPRLIDLSLGRIQRLLSKLGNPQERLPPVIHIAGTNGKGSVGAFLKAMLQAAGKRVHVYSSPHLVRFRERIELAGRDGSAAPIEEAELVGQLARVQRVNAGEPITFFEITTAAAFQAFAEHPADAVILEVGLGGRLDATNVVERPAVTILTPISLDHTDKLGSTIDAIAYEKAGILKPGVVGVVSRQLPEAIGSIVSTGRRVGAVLKVWGEDFEAFEQRGRLIYQNSERLMDLPLPGLMGHHQIINAGTAIASALLKHMGISDAAIESGLTDVRWPARMQRLDRGPLVALLSPGSELWLDGGHNPAGGEVIAETLAELEDRAPKPVGLVVGMMGQKDAGGFLGHFRGLVRRVITVPVRGLHEAPAHDAALLANAATKLGLAAEPERDVESALRRLRCTEAGPLRILICGSLYLAGHVLALQEGIEAQMN